MKEAWQFSIKFSNIRFHDNLSSCSQAVTCAETDTTVHKQSSGHQCAEKQLPLLINISTSSHNSLSANNSLFISTEVSPDTAIWARHYYF